MTSSYDDSVMNFDMGFLHQTSKNTGISRLEKQRQAILLAKQKTINTDGLIRKYYNKKDALEQAERTLFASKEECKQVCIDYKNVLEKCERLENEVHVIQHYNQQLQQKLSDAENQCCGIQSHARQLEVLVKEQETQIESLKIENHLEKSNIKNVTTNTSNLQKQNDILLKDLCILGKLLIGTKNLSPRHKAVLQKYEIYLKHEEDSCNDSGGVNSDNEMDLYEDNLMSPQSPPAENLEKDEQKVQSSSVEVQEVIVVNLSSTESSKPNEIDGCSVCSNDIASADTGRGSSLAFSDSEKCLRSPDYLLNDNHSSPEFTSKTVNDKSVGTSPVRDIETIDIATSPINFETQTIPTFIVDKAVSPIKSTNIENVSNLSEVRTSQIMIDESIQNDSYNQGSSFQATKCLQVNSSNIYNDENSRDCEIEMILSKMQFDRDLITPMPSSPCSSHGTVISRVSGCQTNHNDFVVCQDAAKLREENKVLHASIADLAKEIVNIKSILKMNPIDVLEKNTSQVAEFSESNTSNEKNITEQTLKKHNEIDTDNDDLIDMVDLVQICATDDLVFSDYCDMNTREHEKTNDKDINNSSLPTSHLEAPIVIAENTSEGIMSRLEFEEDILSESNHPDNLNDINSNNIPEATTEKDSAENVFNSNERIRRLRKLNNLEKLRRKLAPKCKIRREKAPPTRKHLIKKQIGKTIRQIRLNVPKKKVTPADSSASLNEKTVYDNAVKIMTELKSKQSGEPSNKSISKSNYDKSSQETCKLTPKQTEKSLDSSEMNDMSSKSAKKRLFDVSNSSNQTTEKPFDISDLISKQTPRPVVKSVSTPQVIQNIRVDKQQNKQSLNNFQPIICIDRIQHKTDRQIECINKSHNIENRKRLLSLSPSVTTRSRSRFVENPSTLDHVPTASEDDRNETQAALPKERRKRLKRVASDEKQEIEHKRILRSSTRHSNCENYNLKLNNNNIITTTTRNNENSPRVNISSKNEKGVSINNVILAANKKSEHNSAISYDDLDMFDEQEPKRKTTPPKEADHNNPKDSILCTMLDRYSLCKINFNSKKIPDGITNTICNLIEDNIKKINDLQSNEAKTAMDDLIENLQPWNPKQFLSGFMKYLQDPQRKVELYSKVNSPPAPAMTKSEQILIYVVAQLKNLWSTVDIVNYVLSSIEFVMFKLNRSPEFDTVESMSHFYAVLCRYFKMKTRLRLFMLDAMYCMQFKAIALIRQCMDVWMHILPLAHMGIAKNPLVTCVVYLLHFYKCEDHFNRVQDIRNILNRKYSYQMSEWNETKILDMFRNAIWELRDIPLERKMLRLSLIILTKRQGARWCQKNIISNMLQPIIENKTSPDLVKQFCVSMIGPLLKPFPVDMKVHCEIVMNLLLNMIKQNPSPSMEEAIYTSLIYMSKHNQNRVISALLSWHPKQLSSECRDVLRNFVREKPANAWKTILSRINISDETENRTENQ